MGEPVPRALDVLWGQLVDGRASALDRLRAGDALREALEAWLPALADAARVEEGRSWADIGSALRISRQAAHQRLSAGAANRRSAGGKPATHDYNRDPADRAGAPAGDPGVVGGPPG